MTLAADRKRYFALAEDAVQKAITLDDSLAEAHETLGSFRLGDGDLQSGEEQLMRAIALDPGAAAAHERLVSLLLWMGRPADALAQAERGVELDPLAPEAHAELARALMGNDRCDEALAELDKLSRLQIASPTRRADGRRVLRPRTTVVGGDRRVAPARRTWRCAATRLARLHARPLRSARSRRRTFEQLCSGAGGAARSAPSGSRSSPPALATASRRASGSSGPSPIIRSSLARAMPTTSS